MSGELHEISLAIGDLTASLRGVKESMEHGNRRFDSIEKAISDVGISLARLSDKFADHVAAFDKHMADEEKALTSHSARLGALENLRTKGLGFVAGIAFLSALVGQNVHVPEVVKTILR